MICPPYKLLICKPVQFVDCASIYPYVFELRINSGFGSDRARFPYSHTDRPLTRQHAAWHKYLIRFLFRIFSVKKKDNHCICFKNKICHIGKIKFLNKDVVLILSLLG